MAAKKSVGKTPGRAKKKLAAKGAKKPVAKKPVAKKPVAKKPAPKTKAPATKKPATKKPPAPKPAPRAPGETRYWLLKTEPDVFSFADLEAAPGRTTHWDGVRNYQARNTLRDDMKQGDLVLIYHSNAEPPHVAGIAEVAREGYPDPSQFDPADDHFDPASKRESPTWIVVDVRAVRPLRPVGLPTLRATKGLEKMVLLQRGSRLSVQPVSPEEWTIVTRLGGA